MGVLNFRSTSETHILYRPIQNYLSETLERPVELVVLTQDTQFTEIERGDIDFILTNPLASVQIQRFYGIEFLATISRINTGVQFSGIVVVRNDGEITSVEDMHDKTAACVNFETAAAGCLFQISHLLEHGFDPFNDFSSFVENPSQDNIVIGVINGIYDVGFVRTGQVEQMISNGSLPSLDDILIVDPIDDGFFFTHTTTLYPEWPFAASIGTDAELVRDVQAALLDMPASYQGLADNGILGFEPTENYTQLRDLIMAFQLPSWDEAEQED